MHSIFIQSSSHTSINSSLQSNVIYNIDRILCHNTWQLWQYLYYVFIQGNLLLVCLCLHMFMSTFQVSTPPEQPRSRYQPGWQALENALVSQLHYCPIPGTVWGRWQRVCGWEHDQIQRASRLQAVPTHEAYKMGCQGVGNVRELHRIRDQLPDLCWSWRVNGEGPRTPCGHGFSQTILRLSPVCLYGQFLHRGAPSWRRWRAMACTLAALFVPTGRDSQRTRGLQKKPQWESTSSG